MAHIQPITIASLLQVAQGVVSGKASQAAGTGQLDDVDLAGLVRSGRVQFVDAQGQPIPPGQEEAIARSVLSAIAAKTGKAFTDADVAELTQALRSAGLGKLTTQAGQLLPAKGKNKADGTANQEFLAALVSQMVQAQGIQAPDGKNKSVGQVGVIRVSVPNLSSSAAAAGPTDASSAQALVGTVQLGQNASAVVADAAAQAQAIQGQAEAKATSADGSASVANGKNVLTEDALAAAVVQAEQAVAAAAVSKIASVAKAKSASSAAPIDAKASALPANPLGIVLPGAAHAATPIAANPVAAKTPAVAATNTDNPSPKGTKPSEKSSEKSGQARLAAAVAGSSLNHDAMAAAQAAAAGSGTTASIAQGAQVAAAAESPAGANLPMPAALADQIAGQLPLDGTMPGLITIHLNPPELGRLQLTFENDSNGGVAAVIRAENPDTLAQLRQEMPSVMEKISETGVNLKRVEVTLSGQQGNATDSAGREGMWQQARQEHPLRWGGYEEDAPAPEAAAATSRSAGWTSATGLNVWI